MPPPAGKLTALEEFMRRFRWLALLAILAVVAGACGGGTTATTSAPDTTGAADTTAAAETTVAAETTAAAETTVATETTAAAAAEVRAPDCDYGGKIESVTAPDPLTVVFSMCSPVPAFQQIIAFTAFGIQPAEHLEATGGAPLDNPIGTGPFVLENWARGDSITFQANQDWWGEPPAFQTLVFRWSQESPARLLELQSGNADYVTNLATADIPTVENDSNLQLLPVANPNTFYLGIATNNPEGEVYAPFDDVRVRQALAMGINRQQIVDNFYPEGSEVASHFTPCAIENGCQGDEWYEFDADAARDLLADAGVEEGFETTIFFRAEARPYLLEPTAVANELAQQLSDNLGWNVTAQVVESGEFIETATATVGYPLYMLGWGADYPHITNFLDFHFGEANPQFGTAHPEIYENLVEASAIPDAAETAPLYEAANNAIKELVPVVPIAHGALADAALATLEGAAGPSFGAPQFEFMNPGKDTLVQMQTGEPISLFCADETDGESLAACQQVVETLLGYDLEGNVIPELATGCESNEDATEWTCALREGVTFHDGSDFDAGDVVASFGLGIDAANPLHVGNSGAFEYYSYLWDSLINPPPPEE
jgi:ABC-type transport system substrate-binding protein